MTQKRIEKPRRSARSQSPIVEVQYKGSLGWTSSNFNDVYTWKSAEHARKTVLAVIGKYSLPYRVVDAATGKQIGTIIRFGGRA